MGNDDPDLAALVGMTREQLHAHAVFYYKTGHATVPDVVLVACGARQAIFKDYGRTQGWFSRWVAPLLIRREAKALTALEAVAGVPRLYRQLDARAVLIEHFPAIPWRKARPNDRAYQYLSELIETIHARGVAHCDLRGAGNILVDDEDRPYLIDFVSHIRRGQAWNVPWNWIFRRFEIADQSALAKLRLRHAEHLARPEDYVLRDPDDWLSKLARRVGGGVRWAVRLGRRSR